MANYNTIFYTRQAVQLNIVETQTEMPLSVNVDGTDFQVYRDSQGQYIIVDTSTGRQRANEGQWIVLMADAVPTIPDVNEVKATGTFVISGVANGDGDVGFSYNGIDYKYTPTNGQTAVESAELLGFIINSNFGLTALVIGDTIHITSQAIGTNGNVTLINISTDSAQSGTPTGLSGGINFEPEIPGTPALFEIYNDGDFQLVYEPTP